jgi:hypothetical protein
LAAALADLLLDRAKARRLGEQGRVAVFAERSITRSAERLAAFFDSLRG